MRTRWLTPILATGLCVAACKTTRVGEASSFEEAIRTYAVAEGRKAMAVAADESGKRAWGVQYGKSLSDERTVREALETCDASAKRLGVEADCYLFAVGDRQPRSTLEKCQADRINRRRCAVQQEYAPLLTP